MILTIDPGIRFAAVSVLNENGEIKYSETIKFNGKHSQEKRMYEFYSKLCDISSEFDIRVVVVESQFVQIMGNIVGMVMTYSGFANAELIRMNPSRWKKLATGKGNIGEAELREKIISIFPLAETYSEHQIDTLGMYLAYKNLQELGDASPVKKSNKRKNPSKD
jgi:Holliday junction resolvasome RuvABC endonuclease subunit